MSFLARIGVFVLGSIVLAYLVRLQVASEEFSYGGSGSGLLIFTIVNLNIAVLCILIFLVGRNVVKLIFDRRRGMLGSKLRTRLLFAFVGITLVPTTILFLQASGLLSRAMEGWFSTQIELAVDGAVEIGKRHYKRIEGDVEISTQSILEQFQQEQLSFDKDESIQKFLDAQRIRHGLFSLALLKDVDQVVIESQAHLSGLSSFEVPPFQSNTTVKALEGERSLQFERKDASQFIRAYVPVILRSESLVLVVTYRINPELVELFNQVTESFKEYEQTKILKNQLQSAFLLTLAMITGLMLFAAIWFAFYLSRELATPIQQLAEGIERVARGKYDFQLRSGGDDELGTLVAGFNVMTKDLKRSRTELELRQAFVEKVVSNLTSAVIVVDTDAVVTLVNPMATTLGVDSLIERYIGKSLRSSFPDALAASMSDIIHRQSQAVTDAEDADAHTGEYEQEVLIRGRPRKLQVHFAFLASVGGLDRSLVLFVLDDITDLAEAQKMSVWKEAAKRIAHEIKNPLTPIQLSAQRLEKMLTNSPHFDKAKGALSTILDNVQSIQRLASEFSNFARMPTKQAKSFDPVPMIQSVVVMFAENHEHIQYRLLVEKHIGLIEGDEEQLRRVVVNLLANASSVFSTSNEISSEKQHSDSSIIHIRLSEIEKKGVEKTEFLRLEVSDNGPGVPDELKRKIFDPYFTTREEGTGLGLAIVSSIIYDHGGTIEVRDAETGGAVFEVILPLKGQA